MTGGIDRGMRGGVLQLILDAPHSRNALSRTMLAALAEAVRDVATSVTGLVISGRGDTLDRKSVV